MQLTTKLATDYSHQEDRREASYSMVDRKWQELASWRPFLWPTPFTTGIYLPSQLIVLDVTRLYGQSLGNKTESAGTEMVWIDFALLYACNRLGGERCKVRSPYTTLLPQAS